MHFFQKTFTQPKNAQRHKLISETYNYGNVRSKRYRRQSAITSVTKTII